MLRIKLAVSFLLLTISIPSEGKLNLGQGSLTCTSIEKNVDRLICYDQAHGYKKEKVNALGHWKFVSKIDPLDDTVQASIYVRSEYSPYDPRNQMLRESGHDTFFIRCTNELLEIFIDWGGDYKGQSLKITEPAVTFRIGSENAKSSIWLPSEKRGATFYPLDSHDFLESLSDSHKLAARIQDSNKRIITAVFNLSGIDIALERLNPKCIDDGLADYTPAERKLIRRALSEDRKQ
ncbi:type VI secretion system-associated protein TagO [Marinobacter sp. KM021]|uniref:hypothetical protein n=1 Tax=Marinobacter sp. KM021 TaxID=3075616 RepID=UPI003D6AEFD3